MPAVGLNQPDGLSTSCFINFVDDDCDSFGPAAQRFGLSQSAAMRAGHNRYFAGKLYELPFSSNPPQRRR
jgi:hypothetical protein